MAAIAQNKLRIKGFYLLVLWPFAGLFVSLRQYLRFKRIKEPSPDPRKIWNIFPAPNHHVVYDLVRKHSLYNKTTEKYKAFVNNNFNYYLENEWSELWKSIK